MLKKEVKYTDYDGREQVEVCYFHLNKFEWLELETYTKGGLVENLQHALETSNAKKTIDILKKILLRAFGRKNPETGEFEKSDEIAIAFSKTEAFSELFYELAYDAAASRAFFLGLIPAELREKAVAELDKRDAESSAANSNVIAIDSSSVN